MFLIRCESSKQNGKKAILSVLSIIKKRKKYIFSFFELKKKKKKKVQNPVLFKV